VTSTGIAAVYFALGTNHHRALLEDVEQFAGGRVSRDRVPPLAHRRAQPKLSLDPARLAPFVATIGFSTPVHFTVACFWRRARRSSTWCRRFSIFSACPSAATWTATPAPICSDARLPRNARSHSFPRTSREWYNTFRSLKRPCEDAKRCRCRPARAFHVLTSPSL
jgi:hypothetical protein